MIKIVKFDHFEDELSVCLDIVAPLYWWNELDSLKMCDILVDIQSIENKIINKKFEINDFSHEGLTDEIYFATSDLDEDGIPPTMDTPSGTMDSLIYLLNDIRGVFLGTKDDKYLSQIIKLLPSSYMQLRIIALEYQNIIEIAKMVKDGKVDETGFLLDEWNDFVDFLFDKVPMLEKFYNDIYG